MSTRDTETAVAEHHECPVIDGRRAIQRIQPRLSDVGGMPVARVLPRPERRLIGAWCFLDHAGPARFERNAAGMRVGPHPHIGLQTFTWMIEGEVLHRDSLGTEQVIRPGQVNLMTAGRGISHTEESVPGTTALQLAQLWIALPYEDRQTAPRFDHYPTLPQFEQHGVRLTLLIGDYAGHHAPTLTFSPLVGVDLTWSDAVDAEFQLDPAFEWGMLPLEGPVEIDGNRFAQDELAYLGTGRSSLPLRATGAGRAMLIGGEPFTDKVTLWWNFVGHGKAEIERAQADWEAHSERFGEVQGFDGPRLSPPPIPWARGIPD